MPHFFVETLMKLYWMRIGTFDPCWFSKPEMVKSLVEAHPLILILQQSADEIPAVHTV
jgi:hypothetical protein